MKYHYFVSWYYSNGERSGFGNTTFRHKDKVTEADLTAWADMIQIGGGYDHRPTIMFFTELEEDEDDNDQSEE